MEINAEFNKIAHWHTADMEWVASPMAGVDRRMLDRIGGEVARATSIVRYAEGSSFSAHTHSGGEEFLVLSGVFQDEHGDYPVGTYVRNPIGTAHTPASEPGCEIFVKLWQFGSDEKHILRINTNEVELVEKYDQKGVLTALLYHDDNETVEIQQWLPNADVVIQQVGGVEMLVMEGEFSLDNETFVKHDWLRVPKNKSIRLKPGDEGTRIWMKSGHLTHITVPSAS